MFALNVNRVRVVAYSRVSTEDDKQLNSLKNQREYFEKYINNNENWELVGEYFDEGKSGTSMKNRPAFLKMIEDAKHRKFDLILTKEVSRFARNTLDSLNVMKLLKEYGINVIFVNDSLSIADINSQLRFQLFSVLAEEESRKTSERVKWGHKKAFNDGVVITNGWLWGYKQHKGKLSIKEDEAEIVRLVFDLYVNKGLGFRKIILELEEQGIKNRNGNSFSPTTLKRMIKNPKYKGTLVQGKTSKDFMTKKVIKSKEDDWIVIEEGVPAIIDKETWEKAQEICNSRKNPSKQQMGVYKGCHVYSGKIICGKCGRSYWHQKYKTMKNDLWQCKGYREFGKRHELGCDHSHIYTYQLDSILKEVIFDLWENRHLIVENIMKVVNNVIKEKSYEKEMTRLHTKLNKVNHRTQNLIKVYTDGDISKEEFLNAKKENVFEQKQLEKELSELEAQSIDISEKKERLLKIQETLINQINFTEINEDLIKLLLNKIIVKNKDELEIYLYGDRKVLYANVSAIRSN